MIKDWNKVYYFERLDSEIGLPSLPDKSIDLCITDPPFNIGIKPSPRNINPKKRKISPKALVYEDNREDYDDWCQLWYNEVKRICTSFHCFFNPIVIMNPFIISIRFYTKMISKVKFHISIRIIIF